MHPWMRRVSVVALLPLTLVWDPVPDPAVEGYRLYQRTPGTAWTSAQVYDAGLATEWQVPVETSQAYEFTVRSLAGGVESVNSNVVLRAAEGCCAELDLARAQVLTAQVLLRDVYAHRAAIQQTILGIEKLGPHHALRKQLPALRTHLTALDAIPLVWRAP